MKPIEIKFLIYTADLAKTQACYSALGISWWGGQEVEIGKTGLPLHAEAGPAGLPHLCGDFGNTEFMFFRDAALASSEGKGGALTLLYYEDEESVASVLAKLRELGLFVPAPPFDEKFNRIICDPDGRRIELCSPNPFHI